MKPFIFLLKEISLSQLRYLHYPCPNDVALIRTIQWWKIVQTLVIKLWALRNYPVHYLLDIVQKIFLLHLRRQNDDTWNNNKKIKNNNNNNSYNDNNNAVSYARLCANNKLKYTIWKLPAKFSRLFSETLYALHRFGGTATRTAP